MAAIGVRVEDLNTHHKFERTFQRLPIRIGRNPLNDLQLEFPFVSAFHAVIEERDGRLILRDLGSTNGTRLRTGRMAANQTAELAQYNNEFAILPVSLTVYELERDLTPAPSRPAAPLLAVTTMYQQAIHPPLPLASAPVQKDYAKPLNALASAVAASREASHALLVEVERHLVATEPAYRAQLAEQIAKRYPDLPQNPDFTSLLTRLGLGNALPAASHELVVQAVKEIAAQHLPTLGPPDSAEGLANFLTHINEALRVFLNCFVPLRDGNRQIAADLGLIDGRPSIGLNRVPTVENSLDAKELAQCLLDWRKRNFDAAPGIERAFADIMIQQVAMVGGVKSGVRSLLEELSPKLVEEMASKSKTEIDVWMFNRYRKLWQEYCRLHSDFCEDEQTLFRAVFGDKFDEGWRRSRDRASQV